MLCGSSRGAPQGQDPPLRKDEDLPDWLWKLAAPDKTLNELRRIKQSDLSPEQVLSLHLCCRVSGCVHPDLSCPHLLPRKSLADCAALFVCSWRGMSS